MKTSEIDPPNRRYGVFIIESLSFEDERHDRLDGKRLAQMLQVIGIPCEYFYIRTKLELIHLTEVFDESELAFLHLSCHGNLDYAQLGLESISYNELASILGPSMFRRRLFLSACNLGTFEFAKHYTPKYHCFSVIGSPDDLSFDEFGQFWCAFYHLAFLEDCTGMNQKAIKRVLGHVTNSFNLDVNYFSIIKNSNSKSLDHLRLYPFSKGKLIDPISIRTPFCNVFRTAELQ